MAAISFKNINRAALAERRVHKKLTLITIILYSVAMVLFLFNSDIFVANIEGQVKFHYFQPSMWGVFFALIGVIIGYITALNCFRDMNNQQISDVTMALPIRAEERFLSKLMTILYIQIIPQLIAVFGGCGLALLFGIISAGGNINTNVISKFFAVVLMVLAASMFTIAIAVLCACCSGAYAESIYFSLILMVIINALPICFAYRIFDQCSGISWVASHMDIFSYWGFMFTFGFNDNDVGFLQIIRSCVVGILISAAVCFAMMFVYRKRDARSVGNPISNRIFFEVIMFLGVMTVYTAFIMSSAAFWGLLIAAVIYFIISIIVSRAKINYFSFLKWGAKFIATTLVFAAIIAPAIKTGGFGFINVRPSNAELDGSEIYISYRDFEETDNYSQSIYLNLNFDNMLTEEQAAKVTDIYKKYLVRGRSKLNPINVILNELYWGDEFSSVQIVIFGKTLSEKPNGPFVGYNYLPKHYDNSNLIKGYALYFEQELEIPIEDARAMAKELKELDFIHNTTVER